MKKIRSRWVAWMAVFVLLGLAIRQDIAYGAGAIDIGNNCSIAFDLSSNYQKTENALPYEKTNGYEELANLEIAVDIYKVADVKSTGEYKGPETNRSLYEVVKTELGKAGSVTTASEWMAMAAEAAKKAKEEPSLAKTSVVLNDGSSGNKAEGLATGLYLVMANQAESPEYIYKFDPYLVSLPGNSYDPSDAGSKDEWLYDVTMGLKASREERYGDLEITKTLKSYNVTLGGASFIFEIKAKKDDRIVFNDVRCIVFDNAGTKSVKVEGKIPADAEVTVTEVYSGASYKAVADKSQTTVIIADTPVGVSFINGYDERLNGGSSVTDHFIAKGGDTAEGSNAGGNATGTPKEPADIIWDVEQLKDSLGQTGGLDNEKSVE